MKIAVNTLPLLDNLAGAERYAQNIIRQLGRLDARNEYDLILSQINQDCFDTGQTGQRKKVFSGNTRNKLVRILTEQVLLPRWLKQQGIDLLFSPCNVAPRLSRVPLVVTLFDLHWLIFPELFHPLRLLYLRRALAWSARRAQAVLTISEHSKNDIVRLLQVPEKKITVVYPGVAAVFNGSPARDDILEIKKKFRISNKFILFVGQLHKRKNALGLIRAYRQLNQRGMADYQLVLVGRPGDGSAEVEELVREEAMHRVVLTGSLPDEEVLLLYHAAECLVYPSFYEGFGLPIIEAMACGCPVITSNCSSMPEVAGEAALLIDPHRIETITDGLVSLLSDPVLSQSLVQQGRKRAGRFTWEAAARQTLAVFERVGAARRS